MPKASPLQSNFSGGEFSPLLSGRVDADRYGTGLATCLNYIPVIQGGLVRRPGTKFAYEVKDSTKSTRLVSFEFSTTQAYIIEFGDQYVRFYRNNGIILDAGLPYEVVTPYLEADLFELKFTQSADVLYITHPNYAQRKLTRTGHTNWTLTAITFLDGPYMATNITTTTLTPSAATGVGITVTASATTGINNDTGFQTTDVGRVIRMQQGTTWGYVRITGWTSTTVVTADVILSLTSTAAKSVWRLGLWSDTTGYPSCSTFYEDRLFFAGSGAAPNRLDGSKSGDYENFSPTATDGTTAANNAVAFTFNSKTVNNIRWLENDERAISAGTVSSEWVVRPSTLSEALSPTNISAKEATTYGSRDVAPLKVGKSVLFVQRAGRQLWELRYVYEVDGFNSDDMTEIAEHITYGGIVEMAYQQQPHSVVWAVRGDGVLLGLTYRRQIEGLRVGWHRHELGGFSDAAHTARAKVESVAVIPSANGAYDELWMVVQRNINGNNVRYVEYMAAFFSDADTQADAYFVDCGASYSGAPATVISGLTHLEGESVVALADGAVTPAQVVTGGQITLSKAASKVHVGYGYNSDGKQLRIEAGSADGTALGKTRRTHRVGILVHRSLGLKIGMSFTKMDTLTFRKTEDPMDIAPELATGMLSQRIEANYDFDNQFCFRQDQPLPSTVLAIGPQLVLQDRG